MGTTSEVFSAVILLIITLLFGVFVGSELTKKRTNNLQHGCKSRRRM